MPYNKSCLNSARKLSDFAKNRADIQDRTPPISAATILHFPLFSLFPLDPLTQPSAAIPYGSLDGNRSATKEGGIGKESLENVSNIGAKG